MGLFYHPLRFESEQCNGCMSCLRACPARAIRIRMGKAVMLEDRCIDCGECMKACTRNAVVALTDSIADLSKFDYTVAIPSPALYTQFDAAPNLVVEALKRCGFDHVESVSLPCAAATMAIEMFLAENRAQQPFISSFCPAVVRLVQVNYSNLVEQLVPILPPRELAARSARERVCAERSLAPERVGMVYVTPCPAKSVAIVDHPGMRRSSLDAAVAIKDLYRPLAAAIAEIEKNKNGEAETETAWGVRWAFPGGRSWLFPAEDSVLVAGMQNVIRILDDLEKGKLRKYSFIEAHACPEGCVSGPLTVENPYVARAKAIRLTQELKDQPTSDRLQVEQDFHRGLFSMTERTPARPLKPLDGDIAKAIGKMRERDRLNTKLPRIDCGACGAPSCLAFAEDVVLGAANERDCVFMREKKVRERLDELVALMHK